jgi:hypothetical protein
MPTHTTPDGRRWRIVHLHALLAPFLPAHEVNGAPMHLEPGETAARKLWKSGVRTNVKAGGDRPGGCNGGWF